MKRRKFFHLSCSYCLNNRRCCHNAVKVFVEAFLDKDDKDFNEKKLQISFWTSSNGGNLKVEIRNQSTMYPDHLEKYSCWPSAILMNSVLSDKIEWGMILESKKSQSGSQTASKWATRNSLKLYQRMLSKGDFKGNQVWWAGLLFSALGNLWWV